MSVLAGEPPRRSPATRFHSPPQQSAPLLRPSRMRVLLCADQRLVEESVRVALVHRGLTVSTLALRSGDFSALAKQRSLAAQRLQLGLAIGDLDEGQGRRDMSDVIRSVRVPWLVLVKDPTAVRWGFLVEAGIAALLPTSIAVDRLLVVMTRVVQGQQLMSPQSRAERIARWQDLVEREVHDIRLVEQLSTRERSVVACLEDGMTIAEIAELSAQPQASIRVAVQAILRKLEVRTQIAALATYRRGVEAARHDTGSDRGGTARSGAPSRSVRGTDGSDL